MRNLTNRSRNFKREKIGIKNDGLTINLCTDDSSVEKGKGKTDWQQVSYRKGKNDYSIQLEKAVQRKAQEDEEEEISEEEELQNEGVQMQANRMVRCTNEVETQNQGLNEDLLGLPVPPNMNLDQGINLENVFMTKPQQLDEESFKTGIARTFLTEQMKDVNMHDEDGMSRRKKARNTMNTASSNSKNARFSNGDDDDV